MAVFKNAVSVCTPQKMWQMMAGRSGYALVRAGEAVYYCVTLES